jgi:hypothetical protein
MIKTPKSIKLLLLLALLAVAITTLWLILAKPTIPPITLPPPEEATAEQIQKAWRHWSAAAHRNDYEEATRLMEWLDQVTYLRLQKQAPK